MTTKAEKLQIQSELHTVSFQYRTVCQLVLATGPGNPPAVRVPTTKSSVQFQTRPKTQPAASSWAKPGHVFVDKQVLPSLAAPVGSNLRFRFSGISIYGQIQIS